MVPGGGDHDLERGRFSISYNVSSSAGNFGLLPPQKLASGLLVNVNPDFRMGPLAFENFPGCRELFFFQFILDLEVQTSRGKEIFDGALEDVLQHICKNYIIWSKGRP